MQALERKQPSEMSKTTSTVAPEVSKALATIGSVGGKNGVGFVKKRPAAHYELMRQRRAEALAKKAKAKKKA